MRERDRRSWFTEEDLDRYLPKPPKFSQQDLDFIAVLSRGALPEWKRARKGCRDDR